MHRCHHSHLYIILPNNIFYLIVVVLYPVRTMWTTLPPDLRDGLVLDVGA